MRLQPLILICLLFVSHQVMAADPDWIVSGVIDKYRSQQWLTAVGEGTTREDARKSAFSRLAEQIKVNISSESDILKEYRSSQGNASQTENVDIRISTKVNLDNLEGVNIVAKHFQESTSTYFAFAVVNRTKTASKLLFEIESDLAEIRRLHKQGQDQVSGGQGAEGVRNLLKATHIFEKVNSDLEVHKLFANPGSASLIKTDVLGLINEIDSTLQSVMPRVEVLAYSAEKPGSPELGVDEPYQVAFSFQGQPLARLPVKVIPDVEGFVIDTTETTDSRGELMVRVRSFPYSGRDFNRLKAQLDIYNPLFSQRAPSADLVVMLTRKSNVSIALETRIDGADHLAGIAQDGLANMLGEQNYNVVGAGQSADFVLRLRGSVVPSPGINGIYFTRIDGALSILNGNNQLLKTLKIDREGTKAGGLNEGMAAEKAVHKLADSLRNELLETLEANLGRN